jgi:hypothetical protein
MGAVSFSAARLRGVKKAANKLIENSNFMVNLPKTRKTGVSIGQAPVSWQPVTPCLALIWRGYRSFVENYSCLCILATARRWHYDKHLAVI